MLVLDEDGATDEVSADVIVVDRGDDPLCDCDLGCQAETSTCTEDGCFGQHLSDRAADNEVEAAPTPTLSAGVMVSLISGMVWCCRQVWGITD